MIPVKELRVGSWVKNIIPVQVEFIDKKDNSFWVGLADNSAVNLKWIEPILITEDILIKAGFIKDYSGWDYPKSHFSLTDKFYPCWLDKMIWPQGLDEFKERKLSHVHQLQNIFNTLTGKELKINL